MTIDEQLEASSNPPVRRRRPRLVVIALLVAAVTGSTLVTTSGAASAATPAMYTVTQCVKDRQGTAWYGVIQVGIWLNGVNGTREYLWTQFLRNTHSGCVTVALPQGYYFKFYVNDQYGFTGGHGYKAQGPWFYGAAGRYYRQADLTALY